MSDPDFPDVPCDGVSVAAGPYGLAVSFLLTDPYEDRSDAKLPGRIVARVRLSPLLAQALADVLVRSIANMPAPHLTFEDPSADGHASSEPEGAA